MRSFSFLLPGRRFALAGSAIIFGAALVQAQTASLSNDTSSTESPASYSSSNDFAFTDAGPAEPGTPGGGSGGGQYDNRGRRQGLRYAFHAGAGFNAPIGNDIPYITWGGNLTLGGGLHLTPWFSLLGEYSFMANKLPGALVAAGGGDTGNAHINSITFDPVIDLFPKHSNGIYLVGGGGWYHKSTNWNVIVGYDFYGFPVYATARSFSSNQAGVNGGFGIYHRLGGVYGDGTMKLFAEARYLWINTPPLGEPNGLGTTGLIPVTMGVRW